MIINNFKQKISKFMKTKKAIVLVSMSAVIVVTGSIGLFAGWNEDSERIYFDGKEVVLSDERPEGPALVLENSSKPKVGRYWKIYNMTGGYGDSLQFWNYGGDNWGDKFTITDAGNVGIGTNKPEAKLHVEGQSIFHFDDWGNDVIIFRGQKSGAPNYWGEYAIRPTYLGLFFWNTQTNKEMLTIYTNGNLNVPGTVIAQSYACSSDARYKKNITPILNSLQKLMSMNGVYYNWKKEEFKDKNFPAGRQIGFIAQDVEKILPELVYTDKDGYKSMSYDKLTAVLVEAVKEEHKTVTLLKKENIALSKKVADLEKLADRVARLEGKGTVIQAGIVGGSGSLMIFMLCAAFLFGGMGLFAVTRKR